LTDYGRAVELGVRLLMEFEWDAAKDAANLAKHGISFVRALSVFDDPNRLEEDSTRPEHGEQRGKAIGLMGKLLVTVIYTDRQDRRRIISARRAWRDERARYGQSATTS
jgi:uncharacterized DUF497 family protein